MPSQLAHSKYAESDNDLGISLDPRKFNPSQIYDNLLRMILTVGEGGSIIPVSCRCSPFEIQTLVSMAIEGTLFSDIKGTSCPEILANRLCTYIWGEVVRIWGSTETSKEV